jgi:hypothetical protein
MSISGRFKNIKTCQTLYKLDLLYISCNKFESLISVYILFIFAGFLCPVHTPDGAPCGLLNHLAAMCEVC